MIKDGGNTGAALELEHSSEELPKDVEVHVQTKEGKVHRRAADTVTNSSILHQLKVEKEKIKYLFLDSSKKLTVKNKERLLVSE